MRHLKPKLKQSLFNINRNYHIISNLLLGIFYLFFAIRFAGDFIVTGRFSSILFVFLDSLFLIFAVSRRPAVEVDQKAISWLFAFAGAFLPLLVIPSGNKDYVFANTLQIIGIVISIVSIISLNKSFGVVAANRGIITGGLYKFVRHPLYFSYEISFIGFLINHYSIYNALLLSVHLLCQIERIKYEENILVKDPEYKTYTHRTKWRLMPYVY
jgi:protein-S-isoprenylcysteine O-methyltransferase Ste14